LQGLNILVSYNQNRISNQFAGLTTLFRLMPVTETYKLAQFFPRDANGKITQQQNVNFNILGSLYRSMTVEASYLLYTKLGSFEPRIVYVDNITSRLTGLDTNMVIDDIGTLFGPDRYRLNGSLTWTRGDVTANLFVYHIPSYVNDYLSTLNAGRIANPELITPVKSLTTVDFSANWAVNPAFSIQFSGRNIFKAAAPFTVVDTLPYDTARYDVRGRTLSLRAQLRF